MVKDEMINYGAHDLNMSDITINLTHKGTTI